MKFLSLIVLFLTFLTTANDPAEPFWRDALELRQAGQYSRADAAFSRLIKQFPDSALTDAACWQRLELARDSNDRDYLNRLFEALNLIRNPELKGQVCLELARFFRNRGLSDWTVKAYAHRLTLPGEEGRDEAKTFLRFRDGSETLHATDVQFPPQGKAMADIHRILKQRSEFNHLYAGADIALWDEALDQVDADPMATRRMLLHFIDIYPQSPALFRVYLLLARLEEKQGNPASAMNLLRVALDRSTDVSFLPEINSLLGFLLLRQGQPDRALPHLEAGGNILAAAAAAVNSGNHILALRHTRTACGHFNIAFYQKPADLQHNLGEYVKLIYFRDLGQIATLDPRVLTAITAGHELLNRSPAQALSHFRKAMTLDPLHDGACLGVTLAAILAGGQRDCDDALETLLHRHPADIRLIRLSALHGRMNRQVDREGRALFQLLTLDPGPVHRELQRITSEGVDFIWPVSR